MGAANGFITTSPDAQFGDANIYEAPSRGGVSLFVAPLSGTLEVVSIGGYFFRTAAGATVKLAIFDDDGTTSSPKTMIVNSEVELSITAIAYTYQKLEYVYSGTKPQLVAGLSYYIAWMAGGSSEISLSTFDSGGTYYRLYQAQTYPSWPTDADMVYNHQYYGYPKNTSLYAVCQSTVAINRRRRQLICGVWR